MGCGCGFIDLIPRKFIKTTIKEIFVLTIIVGTLLPPTIVLTVFPTIFVLMATIGNLSKYTHISSIFTRDFELMRVMWRLLRKDRPAARNYRSCVTSIRNATSISHRLA